MTVLVKEELHRLQNHSQGLDGENSRNVMELWSLKLRRSGYPATLRHEVIKTSCEKWDKMCLEKDGGVRPVHRPRTWRESERRIEKEVQKENWHKSEKGQVSAPLIIDPVAGNMSSEMKVV